MKPNDRSAGRIAQFKIFIAQTPDDPFPRYGLAMEYVSVGELEKAQLVFNDLVRNFPDYVSTYLMAGNNLLELGRRDEAMAIYEKGIEVAGRKKDTHARNELQAALDSVRDNA